MNGVRNPPRRWAALLFVGIVAIGYLAMHGSNGVFEEAHASATVAIGHSGMAGFPSVTDLHDEGSSPSPGTHLALGLCLAVAVAAAALIARGLVRAMGTAVVAVFASSTRLEWPARWSLRPPLLAHRVVVLLC